MSWIAKVFGLDKVFKRLLEDFKEIIETLENSIDKAQSLLVDEPMKLGAFISEAISVVIAYKNDTEKALKSGITSDPFKDAREKARLFKEFWEV